LTFQYFAIFAGIALQTIENGIKYEFMYGQPRSHLTYIQALAKASELCSQSEKCCLDIRLKCHEWQLSTDESTQLLDYLLKEKFIDHQRYAISFVNDKFRFNKWGKIKLAYALRQKQLEEIWIWEAISNIPEEQYEEILHELLSSKARSLREKDPFSRRGKLLAFAQSRGFGAEEALRIISEI